jgi:hypothetical protein
MNKATIGDVIVYVANFEEIYEYCESVIVLKGKQIFDHLEKNRLHYKAEGVRDYLRVNGNNVVQMARVLSTLRMAELDGILEIIRDGHGSLIFAEYGEMLDAIALVPDQKFLVNIYRNGKLHLTLTEKHINFGLE